MQFCGHFWLFWPSWEDSWHFELCLSHPFTIHEFFWEIQEKASRERAVCVHFVSQCAVSSVPTLSDVRSRVLATDAAILGCRAPIGRELGDRRHWGHWAEGSHWTGGWWQSLIGRDICQWHKGGDGTERVRFQNNIWQCLHKPGSHLLPS